MSILEQIEAIETPSIRSMDWYYHGILSAKADITDILTEGIKCAKLIGKSGYGNNGRHYISLSKDIGALPKDSAFHGYRRCAANIILDNIHPTKCVNAPFFEWLSPTRFPIRCSSVKDEFQMKEIITPDKFVGVQCALYYWGNCKGISTFFGKLKEYHFYYENLSYFSSII